MTQELILTFILGSVSAYLLGSLSSAVIVCQLLKLSDPRLHGSQNPGTTNVLRLHGKLPAILTLAGDVLKGFLPVFFIKFFTINPWIISSILLCAVLGHLFPLFFQFKGGKGVATALGGIFALSSPLGGIFVSTWIMIFIVTRYSSLSALIAISSLPFWAWFWIDKQCALGLALLAGLIIIRHKENIDRLIHGTESQFKLKK